MPDTGNCWILILNFKLFRILFYGDDTWLSMFTEEPFLSRSEGTSSFFVKDYIEVDTNVTRHLATEFYNQSSWDIMILHFLGLDHIGHSLGGKSPKIHEKLTEMDDVISGVWRNFVSQLGYSNFNYYFQTSSKTGDENIWFILLGDHGMTLAGGHGGSSERESYVPLVIWSSNQVNMDKKEIVNVQQVDLVPTISLLLGLGIPEKSVGILLDEHFSIDSGTLAKKMELNTAQFYLLAQANKGLFNAEEFGKYLKRMLIIFVFRKPKRVQKPCTIHIEQPRFCFKMSPSAQERSAAVSFVKRQLELHIYNRWNTSIFTG
jgi:ethanolaminephosphotransferase